MHIALDIKNSENISKKFQKLFSEKNYKRFLENFSKYKMGIP